MFARLLDRSRDRVAPTRDDRSSMSDERQREEVGFAPNDPSDGRERWDWKSRYDSVAISAIRKETAYLVFLLIVVALISYMAWVGLLRAALGLMPEQIAVLNPLLFGVLGGVMGGTLFSLKWLYHTVARGLWHLDRRLWRCLTPAISGGLSGVTILLIASGLLVIFDQQSMQSSATTFPIGFLVGYFSDSAFGKLAEIANTLFGVSKRSDKHHE